MSPIPAPVGLILDASSEADVVIVCVTHNSASVIEAWLAALPDALQSAGTCRIVVTDNNSSDGTVGIIRKQAPWVDLLIPGENLGYAGGINIALRKHVGRRGVYILNPDAVPAPGSIALLANAVEEHPGVGIGVPRVLTAENQLKFSLRRSPTILRAAGESLFGGHRAARLSWLGEQIRDPRAYRDGGTADWATGAAMFIAPRAIDAVGEWDERFFLYSEETDYALRAKDVGLTLRLVAGATVTHPGGDMEASPQLWRLVPANRTRLYRKRHSIVPSAMYWVTVLGNEMIRSAFGRDRSRPAVRALLRLGPNPPELVPTPMLIQPNGRHRPFARSPGSRPEA